MPLRFLKELDIRPGRAGDADLPRRSAIQQTGKKARLSELDQLAKDLEAAGLPTGTVQDTVQEEMERLKQLSPASQVSHSKKL